MKKLLIDGDIIAYRSSAHQSVWEADGLFFNLRRDAAKYGTPTKCGTYSPCKEVVFGKAQRMIDTIVRDNTKGCEAPMMKVFLSGTTNFRMDICSQYKAQRPTEKPKYLGDVKEFLKARYNTETSAGEEADDVIGIEQYQNYRNPSTFDTVICSTDKDFKTIPGYLYNPVSGKMTYSEEKDALRFFYLQVLMGDKADNIEGLKGVGPIRAESILKNYTTEWDLYRAVRIAVRRTLKVNKSIAEEMILKTGQLLRIRRWRGEIWQLPTRR